MDRIAIMKVVEAFRDIRQLAGGKLVAHVVEGTPTRFNLSASGLFVMYSITSPPDIHSEMSWRGSMVKPRSGTMFGCTKCFHATATWRKVRGFFLAPGNGGTWFQERTSVTFCRSLVVHTRTHLIRTLEPSLISHTHPEADGMPLTRRGSGSVQDFGNNPSMPHILPSSCRDC